MIHQRPRHYTQFKRPGTPRICKLQVLRLLPLVLCRCLVYGKTSTLQRLPLRTRHLRHICRVLSRCHVESDFQVCGIITVNRVRVSRFTGAYMLAVCIRLPRRCRTASFQDNHDSQTGGPHMLCYFYYRSPALTLVSTLYCIVLLLLFFDTR